MRHVILLSLTLHISGFFGGTANAEDTVVEESIAAFTDLSPVEQELVLSYLTAQSAGNLESLIEPFKLSPLGLISADARAELIAGISAQVGAAELWTLALTTLLTAPESTTIENGIYVVSAIGGADAILALSSVALEDGLFPEVRLLSLKEAFGLSPTLVLPIAMSLISDPEAPSQLRTAAIALIKAAPNPAIDNEVNTFLLQSFLSFADSEILQATAHALPEEELPPLLASEFNYTHEQRVALVSASAHRGGEDLTLAAFEQLVSIQDSLSTQDRLRLLASLLNSQPSNFVPFLIDCLAAPEFKVRITAVSVAKRCGWEAFVLESSPEISHILTDGE